jgi:hypothetical protein
MGISHLADDDDDISFKNDGAVGGNPNDFTADSAEAVVQSNSSLGIPIPALLAASPTRISSAASITGKAERFVPRSFPTEDLQPGFVPADLDPLSESMVSEIMKSYDDDIDLGQYGARAYLVPFCSSAFLSLSCGIMACRRFGITFFATEIGDPSA